MKYSVEESLKEGMVCVGRYVSFLWRAFEKSHVLVRGYVNLCERRHVLGERICDSREELLKRQVQQKTVNIM